MNIGIWFTESGSPKTGLLPTINGWESDGTQVLTDEAMSEVGGGFYLYNFSSYDETKDYFFLADGGATLIGYDRYVPATSDQTGQISDIRDAFYNKKVLTKNSETQYTEVLYKDDGLTVKRTQTIVESGDVTTRNNV